MSETLQQQARALGDPTRHAIFRYVADADHPVGVAEINEHFPLNHNAIRQHLAKLVAAGLVIEGKAAGSGPGRPRLVYTVAPGVEGQWGTSGPYERLSLLLVEMIRTGREAEDVGRHAADRFRVPSPSGDPVADVTAAMARQGFEPEVRAARDGVEIVLHRCPFANVALADRSTICALHLGIAEGLVESVVDPDVLQITELVAQNPRRARCRVRLAAGSSRPRPEPVLTLRGRRRPSSSPTSSPTPTA